MYILILREFWNKHYFKEQFFVYIYTLDINHFWYITFLCIYISNLNIYIYFFKAPRRVLSLIFWYSSNIHSLNCTSSQNKVSVSEGSFYSTVVNILYNIITYYILYIICIYIYIYLDRCLYNYVVSLTLKLKETF